MIKLPANDEQCQKMLRQYEAYRKILASIIEELGTHVTHKRTKAAMRTLGLSGDLMLLGSSERFRKVLFCYLIFSERRKGQTLPEKMEGQLRPQLKAMPGRVGEKLLDGLLASELRVMQITQFLSIQGVTVRDVLTDESFFIIDAHLAKQWQVGDQFANQVIQLPELTMCAGEPFETDVSPDDDFVGRALNRHDREKLDVALIQSFSDAVREF